MNWTKLKYFKYMNTHDSSKSSTNPLHKATSSKRTGKKKKPKK